MKLTWAPLAIADRESIFDHIAGDSPDAAVNLDELFQAKAALLIEHPKAGRIGRVQSTRELIAHQHYVFVYDLHGDRVRILRVLHTSRLWPPVKAPDKGSKR